MQGHRITRIEPAAPPEAYRSFQILAPLNSHWRPATCEQAGCIPYREGWVTRVDEGTDLGKGQAYYIRNQSGRRYREERHASMTTFRFEPGQPCFRYKDHRVPLERPSLFVVRDGDWRASQNRRVHASAEDWVDEFANHQDQIADLRQKG